MNRPGCRAGCDNPRGMATSGFVRTWAGAAALLLLVGAVRPLPARGEEGMFEPRFREGKPGDVLVKGEPGLARGNLDAFIDLTEAALDMAWPARDEQELRDALETAFYAAGEDGRRAFLELVRPVTSLREKGRSGDIEGLRAGQRAFVIALDRRIHSAPREKQHRLVTEGIEKSQRAVWKGIPAIRASAADAWLEAGLLLVGLGRNERFEPTDGQRSALQEELDVGLHGQAEAVRERLRLFHRTWLFVKARWDQATDARRFALRWEAVRLLARLLPPEKTVTVVPGPSLADYSREAARVAAQLPAYDAWSNAARHPELVLEALKKGLELPEPLPEHVLLYR
jgi:hypothetical protein